jgi:chemotaxis protein MotB
MKANQARLGELRNAIADVFKDYDKSDLNVKEMGGKLYITVNNSVLFKAGRDRLDKDSKQTITKLAELFRKYSDINVNVEGHTDSDPVKIHKGRFEDNWSLSVARATNVVRAMVDAGIAKDRLTASGKGETQPVASNDTTKAR